MGGNSLEGDVTRLFQPILVQDVQIFTSVFSNQTFSELYPIYPTHRKVRKVW